MSDSSAHPQISHHHFRSPKRGEPMIVAIFSFRYDAHLVPDLIENIRPVVHAYACWDDRGDHGYHSNEPARRNALNAAAIAMGADWILGIDPDERLERRAADHIPQLVAGEYGNTVFVFNLYEMFTPTARRVDAYWARKKAYRLYPRSVVEIPLNESLHGNWFKSEAPARIQPSGLAWLHFHHLSPEREVQRRNAYIAGDPERTFGPFGYDHLIDRRAMDLAEVDPAIICHPPYHEDGHMRTTVAVPDDDAGDPACCLLRRIDVSLRYSGAETAANLFNDLSARNPDDTDLAVFAGWADDLAGRHGNPANPADDFQAPGSLWRRWFGGKATLTEGRQIGIGAMAVVIIGFQAREDLAGAVAAIRTFSSDAEIVVVNTGGGDPQLPLEPHLEHIRLINVDVPCQVGAARNIGIDASRAPNIAFLAGDCLPNEHWISARLARHQAGALSVSTPVVPEGPSTLVGAAMRITTFASRDPEIRPNDASHFGRSYQRRVFRHVGYFPTGVKLGEDNWMNDRVDRLMRPLWEPKAITVHRDPPSVQDYLMDARNRGRNAARSRIFKRSVTRSEKNLAAALARRIKARPPSPSLLSATEQDLLAALLTQWMQNYLQGFREGLPKLKFKAVFTPDTAMELLFGNGNIDELSRLAADLCSDSPEDIHRHLFFAWLKAQEGQIEKALDLVGRAHALAPDSDAPVDRAVEILIAADRPEEALKWAAMARRNAPLESNHHLRMCRLAEELGDVGQAVDGARRALFLRPADVELHRNLARLHLAEGKSHLAELRRNSADEIEAYEAKRKSRGLRR